MIEKYKSLLEKYEVNTLLRVSHFMAQIHHESNLKPISENLNYSKERLLVIFPKYFTKENVNKYKTPQQIANKVYSNRMGNGNELSGDGYKYRGRGFIQLTGRKNYQSLSDYTGIDFISQPDLLLEEPNAMLSALWFWKVNNLNKLADLDNCRGITLRINGGNHGLNHRIELLEYYKDKLKD